MALIKCENCGGNVSDKAKACPHCGRVLNQGVAIVSKPEIEESREVSPEPHPLRKSDSRLSHRFSMTAMAAMIVIIVLAIASYHWYVHRSNTTKASYDSIESLTEAAEREDADAQFELGECYYSGEKVTQNLSEAVKWYRKAAEKGNVNALSNLAVCYQNGYGVPKDLSESEKLWQKIEEQRHN